MNSPNVPPNITLPLPLFLNILWGYKKNAELRDRAVPGQEIVDIIQGVVGYENYLHLEHKPDALTSVWQLAEWKATGERQVLLKDKSDKYNHNVDTLEAALLKSKLGSSGLDRSFIRQLAHNLILTKDYSSLAMFGIKEEDLKI